MHYFQNNWKNIVGLIIVVKNGSNFELEKESGFTHFAEHLMFSGTKRFSRSQLREKHFKLFNRLEAVTSREAVSLFCYFDKENLAEAVNILEQMIFSWQCRRKDFFDEKKMIIAETQDYFSSYQYKMRKSFYGLAVSSDREPLGSLSALRKIDFVHLKQIKKYWDKFLASSPIEIGVIGKLETEKLRFIENRFYQLRQSSQISKFDEDREMKVFGDKNCFGFLIKGKKKSLNYLLLDRIYFWRWYQASGRFDYDFIQLKDFSAFYVYSDFLDELKKISNFFAWPIQEREFDEAKKLFLIFFRQTIETVDVIESLWWFSGFWLSDYQELSSVDPKRIYSYFEKLTFSQFKSFLADL